MTPIEKLQAMLAEIDANLARAAAALASTSQPPKMYCPTDSLAHESAKKTDAILTGAINAVIGKGWQICDLKGRLSCVKIAGHPQETITLDGKPLVELWPVELETVSENGKITIKATRNYRTFSPVNSLAQPPKP